MTPSTLHRGVPLPDAALESCCDGAMLPVAPTEDSSSASSSGSTAFAGSALATIATSWAQASRSLPVVSALPETEDPYRVLSQGELNAWRA